MEAVSGLKSRLNEGQHFTSPFRYSCRLKDASTGMTDQRILLVDDEQNWCVWCRKSLTATGFDVVATGNGREAIQKVALGQPDLILLDIVLTD